MNCPNCQTVNPDAAKFCMNCGISLADVAGKRDESRLVAEKIDNGAKQQFNLDRYLPQELVSKLQSARSRNEMVGERRIVTMLFCDVKGSTAAAEKVDPEIWADIMNGVFEFMIRPIYKYEGFVPRLMGDAILAFFGAPITHEDDPQRAVLAGLEIQEGIKPYAEEIRLKHGLEFGLRVGINTGLVVVGEIGSDLRMEYTALGDAINLAARMEQTAQVGTIQISDETYKLVAPFFEVESLGGIEVKGKSVPIQTYRVLGVKSTPKQLRGLEGLSSSLVGRDSQMALLKDRLKDLGSGKGSVVTVLGEAGLGKSTLIAELKKSTEGSGFNWLKGESLSYTRSISYYPWRQAIRQSVDAYDEDSHAEVRSKLEYVCQCCALPGGDIPFLEAMLVVESEESSKVVMGFQGEALTQRMIDSTCAFLCGLAVESSLVIVFDDLHWSDEASLNLLLNIVDIADTHPIVFICMARPDITAGSWDSIRKMREKLGNAFYSIELDPLPVDQTEILLNNLLGINDLPRSIQDLIIDKADGNPFFVEEMIRSLIETKQIIQENGHWRATGDTAQISLPNTLRGVLSARVDRLAETPKHVLQNAAVIGRLFDLRILRRLTGLNGGLDPQIQHLQDVSLIEMLLEEYAFRHVLIQEATYESILLKKRAELHRQIGEALEEIHANRIEEFAPLIAHHFYSAGDDRSLKYDLISGEKSARLYANAEAAVHFKRALDMAKKQNAEVKQLEWIYLQLGQAYELTGRYHDALETYGDMRAFAVEHNDRSMLLKVLTALATIYSTFTSVHNPKLGENTLKQALDLANELGDIPAQAKLNWNLMINYLFSSRLSEALPYCEPAIELARQLNDAEQLGFALNDSARVYQGVGAFEKALTSFAEAREIWKQQANQVMLADNLSASAVTNFFAGNYDEALSLADQAWEVSKQTDNQWGQSYSRVAATFVYLDRGLPNLAIQAASENIRAGELGGLMASTIAMRPMLAWIYGIYGDTRRGIEMAQQALDHTVEKMPDWKSIPLAVLIRLYLSINDLDSAEKLAGADYLQPVAFPYPRFVALIGLANIELELARKNHQRALDLSDELLKVITPLSRADVHEVNHRKADALIGLNKFDEARQILTEACSLTRELGLHHYLWSLLAKLADVNSKLGRQTEVEDNLAEARTIVAQVAESLRELGLHESFMNQPQVQKLMR